MTERLAQGLHPDTDATFWSDYSDRGPPKLSDPIISRSQALVAVLVGGALFVLGMVAFVSWKLLGLVLASRRA
jgi:hypothetical protein